MYQITKSGRPAAWECGGGRTNTGEAVIWASPDGSRPRAIYVRGRGDLACGEHALVPVAPGMFRIYAEHHRGDYVVEIDRLNEKLDAEPVARFESGEWAPEPPPDFLAAAIAAAREKARCWHCREPHYVA